MAKVAWTTTDRIFYGVFCVGVVIWGVAHLVEACRSRPKVKMIVLAVPSSSAQDKAEPKAD